MSTLKNPISCGEFFQWGARKHLGWKKSQLNKNEKIMENKSTISVHRLAVAGINPSLLQAECDRITCFPQEQCPQIQSALHRKLTLPSNNSFHSLRLPKSTESQMCTRNSNKTEGRNKMQNSKPFNLETFLWPKLSLTLSKREREEDFLAIEGSTLPLRPKKRRKCIQKAIQDISPGFRLSDVSQKRYEVRENKSTRKRPRGLKSMEGVGTDSE